jgi:O-Antigen ligase
LPILFIIPAFFALYYLAKDRQDLAFLNVYLPCLIFLPDYYSFRIPHLPPESAASWALFPLGLSLLFHPIPRLELRRMDLWVVLFSLSVAASELLQEPTPNLAGVGGFVTQNVFAYIVGRRLIEPGLRIATLQRIVLMLVCLAPFVFYEYKTTQNPFINMGARHFHLDIGVGSSIRDGHVRVQGTFSHAILAAMVFAIVFMLNCTLAYFYKRDKSRLEPIICKLERYHVPAILLLLCLWLTQSRGPQLGAVVGYSILQIPRFRHLKVAAFVLALLLMIAGSVVYSYFDEYTSVTNDGTLSEAQTSAIYRRDLLKNYEPVAEKGGWLGWGGLNVPEAGGQHSIDNAYLVIELAQGKFGLYLFLLIVAEALGTTVYRAFTFRSPESRFLAFTLLGAIIGLFQSLTTVYLGGSVAPIFWLLLGWSQSVEDESTSVPKFNFKRLFA